MTHLKRTLIDSFNFQVNQASHLGGLQLRIVGISCEQGALL
jgi:hypothetical protein